MSARAEPVAAPWKGLRWIALLVAEALVLVLIVRTSAAKPWPAEMEVPFPWFFVVTDRFAIRWLAAWSVVLLLRRRAIQEVLAAPRPLHRSSAMRPLLLAHAVCFVGLVVVLVRLAHGRPTKSWVLAGLLFATLGTLAGAGSYLASRLSFSLFRRVVVAAIAPAVLAAIGLEIALTGLAPHLWPSLGWLTTRLVAVMLAVVSPHVHLDVVQQRVGTDSFSVTIGAGCAGFEGIGLIAALLTAYLVVFRARLRFPRALWLLPIGLLTIWLANAVRITALIAIGAFWSREVALGGFHSQMGWIMVTAVASTLTVVSSRSRFFTREPAEPVASTSAPYLIPFVVLMGSLMVSGALSSGFNYFYPIGVLAVGVALASYWRDYRSWSWSWSWSAVAIGAVAWVIWIALEPAHPGATGAPEAIRHLAPGLAFAWIVARVIGSTIAVPLAEELAFRGFFVRRLQASDVREVPHGRFTAASFALSSIAFGLLHGRWLAGTLAGMLFALALYRRRQLSDAVIAHATANALIAVQVLATGRWSLWQ